MADVEISYNNSTIVSMNDSGTEVLETNGKVCADDITIAYTKSGGGGTVNVGVTDPSGTVTTVYYIDANGVYHNATLEVDPETYIPTWQDDVMDGAMIFVAGISGGTAPAATNMTLVGSATLGARPACYAYFFKAGTN